MVSLDRFYFLTFPKRPRTWKMQDRFKTIRIALGSLGDRSGIASGSLSPLWERPTPRPSWPASPGNLVILVARLARLSSWRGTLRDLVALGNVKYGPHVK